MFILIKNKKFNFLFILISVCAFALPYARVMLGSVPIYILTICSLLMMLIAFYMLSKYGVSVKIRIFQFVLIFICLTFFHIQYIGTYLVLYTSMNRLISFLFLFSVFYLNYTNQINKQYLLKTITIGFKFHICLIIFHYVGGLIGGSVLELFYNLIYKIISQSDKFYDRIDMFSKPWYLVRYYGGYHNPNPAGVSLVFSYVILKISNFKIKLVWTYLFFFCLFLTASKQSIALLTIFLIFKNFKRIPVYVIGLIFLTFILSYINLGNLLDRVSNSEDYVQSAGERLWGYVNFLEFISVNPLGFIFGTGINSLSLRSSALELTAIQTGFVSNSFLLIFSFIGVIGFIFLSIVLLSFYNVTKNKIKLLFFIFLFFLAALFDNHIAIMESMQIIIFLGIIVISNIKREL